MFYNGENCNVLCIAVRSNMVHGLASTVKIKKTPRPTDQLLDLEDDIEKTYYEGMSGWNAWSQQILTRKVEGVPLRSAHYAGIYGLDGRIWAGSDVFMKKMISPQSFKKVHEAIDKGAASVSKLEFGDKKFFVLKHDPGSKFVIGKSTKKGAGCTIAKAKSCFVVGIYDNDQVQPANNTSQVCYVRDQLMSAGY